MSNHNDVLTVTTVDPNGATEQPPSPPLQLPPLAISALMVTKADLVQALRIYFPNISDIEAIDADRFLLTVSGAADQNGSNA